MRKLLITLILLPFCGFSQEKSFEIGLLFGGSANSLNGLDSRNAEHPNTYSEKNLSFIPIGGITTQYNLTKKLSIKAKLLYHTKGELIKNPLNTQIDYHSKLNYLTVPILTQFNIRQKRWVFFCNTGFYLGYLTGGSNLYNYNNTPSTLTDDFNKFDFGLVLGAGTSFKINNRIALFFETSFDYGLKNISNTKLMNDDVFLTQAITGAIGVTYNFPTKKKTFNGLSTLDCPDYEEPFEQNTNQKKKSKWRLVLYKDGEKVGGKKKRGKSRLFKNKK